MDTKLHKQNAAYILMNGLLILTKDIDTPYKAFWPSESDTLDELVSLDYRMEYQVIYIPETAELDEGLTANDIIAFAKAQLEECPVELELNDDLVLDVAKQLFGALTWQHIQTIIDEEDEGVLAYVGDTDEKNHHINNTLG